MTFKEFVEMTSTADIAIFRRIALPQVARTWAPEVVMGEEPHGGRKNKRKKFMQPQVKEQRS